MTFPRILDLKAKVSLLSHIRGVTFILRNCENVLEKNLHVEPSNISDSTILTKPTHSQSKLIEPNSEGSENQN